ncbi:DUF6036 family nucleotidyltransferase [Tessaracoccus sp.]
MNEQSFSGQQFTREQILALLTELGADLASSDIRAELFVVGGAALTMAYNTRRMTHDVDGAYEPKAEVTAAAKRVARRHDLPEGWLNDAVKSYLPPGPVPVARTVLDVPGVQVYVPSPDYLLALKVQSARVDRDPDDIRFLATLCRASTADEILAITERVMGGHTTLPAKSRFMIEEMYPSGPRPGVVSRLAEWFRKRQQDRANRPLKPPGTPKTFTAGRCGAPTARGGSCRNRRGSCPNHR